MQVALLPRWAAPSAQGVVCRETKSNVLHSFLCQGWEVKSEPDVQNLKDTRKKKKVNGYISASVGNLDA